MRYSVRQARRQPRERRSTTNYVYALVYDTAMTIPGIFSQRDPKWANLELGYNTDPYYNIYHFGCAVDAAANILLWVTGDWGWNPQRVNQWLKDSAGYAPGGGLIIWGKLADLLRQYDIEYHGFTTNLAATNGWLVPENNFAIAQLKGPGFPMHFSAMPYVGMIADSWDARLKKIGAYTYVGAHLYSRIVHAPAPVQPPAPEPASIQAPVVAPAPDPTPVPSNSNETPQPDPNPAPPAEEPGRGSGDPGEVPVRTPAVGNPVVEDLPAETPEYRETFHPFLDSAGKPEERHILLEFDVDAVDMTGTKPDIRLYAAKGPVRSSGTFTSHGVEYYRGTSGSWYGWPVEAELNGKYEADPQSAPESTPSTPKTPGLSPLAILLRFLGRLGRALTSFRKPIN